MPPRKKTVRSKSTPRKTPARARPARTKALAIGDSVRRETIAASVFDRQLAVIEALMAWSPARMLINQQAAFWGGFATPDDARPSRQRAPSRKRAKKRAAKRA
jgi:hypothetical protein